MKDKHEDKYKVKNGQLYYEDKIIGNSIDSPGFSEYIFDEEPLGAGANAIAFAATHKTLDVKQVVKLYFPDEKPSEISFKIKEETKKNADPSLAGILAVIFDAGEYTYPCNIWYSKMESINSYCTMDDWKEIRKEVFNFNYETFDVNKSLCLCSAHVILNLAGGLLKSIIALYAKGFIHGDLNPGNTLWILEEGEDLRSIMNSKFTKFSYSVLGDLEPYTIKLIDMGTSKANELETAGLLRDSFKLYELMELCFWPLLIQKKTLKAWMNFKIEKDERLSKYAVKRKFVIKKDGTEFFVHPHALAGDFFRLVCVLNLAFGIISNTSDGKGCSSLNPQDISDFYTLMFGEVGSDVINGLSLESMITLRNTKHMNNPGNGELINWEKVWDTYPLNLIDISPVFVERDRCLVSP